MSNFSQAKTGRIEWQGIFIFLTWTHMLWLTSGFAGAGIQHAGPDLATLFHLSTWLCYSFFYLLPLILLMQLGRRLLPASRKLQMSLYFIISATLLLLIRVDYMIYELYSFHINRFVLNLIFTPGGISSLGSDSASYLSLFLMTGTLVSVQAAFLFVSHYLQNYPLSGKKTVLACRLALAACFLTQAGIYGISDINHFSPVLEGSRAYPLFQRIRFRSLAASLGYARTPENHLSFSQEESALNYPLAPLAFNQADRPPNVIMLVAESLRWDQLNEHIMPNTSHFGRGHLRFNNHYSSGNGTREGLFGMFYGLYGSYWEQFMHKRQSPLLMDRMQELDYQFDLRTGATFTYPEFNLTLFSKFPDSALHEPDDDLAPWQRDKLNVDALLGFLDQRTQNRPFMSFLFFESTHASYYFPEEAALYPDYQRNVDYTRMSGDELAANIGPLFNRYHNAAHWIDIQLGRIYDKLEADGLLDNTIVIVTGDHGEEFLEKGAWGHNSAFVEEQIHVPMVMHLPGQPARSIDAISSHLDIATTLLQALGAPAESASYSLGLNLMDLQDRDYIVISDWHSIGVHTADLKYRIPYLNSGADYWEPTDQLDQALPEQVSEQRVTVQQTLLLEAMAHSTTFTKEG